MRSEQGRFTKARTDCQAPDQRCRCMYSLETFQIYQFAYYPSQRCRTLNNFSTMIAITSGLNTPPIRRLKRTWEQVNQRFLAQFAACELTIDSNKNFTKYRQLMASVTPPCVPFIGKSAEKIRLRLGTDVRRRCLFVYPTVHSGR